MIYRFWKSVLVVVYVMMFNVYLFVFFMFNFIIYSVKIKEIRRGIFKVFFKF